MNKKIFNINHPSNNILLQNTSNYNSLINININFIKFLNTNIQQKIYKNNNYNITINKTTYNKTNPNKQKAIITTNNYNSIITINLNFIPFLTNTLSLKTYQNNNFNITIKNTNYNKLNPSKKKILQNINNYNSIITINLSFKPINTTYIKTPIYKNKTFIINNISFPTKTSTQIILTNQYNYNSIIFIKLHKLPTPIININTIITIQQKNTHTFNTSNNPTFNYT